MTVGERIQYHRKKQNLSQEELGQKLLVSRQTVSLWETDQTLPTVDNLRLLRDIFGISIDELLGAELSPAHEPDEPTPLERYTFCHMREHLEAKLKSQRRSLLVYCCWYLFAIAILFMSVMQSDEYLLICLALGFLAAVYAYRYFKAFWELRKKHDSDMCRMLANTLTYNLFENELHIRIQRDGECLENLHIPYDGLAKVMRSEFYYEIYYMGRNYLVPRSLFVSGDPALRSRFEALLETKRASKKGLPPEGKWKVISIALVVASIAAWICAELGFESIYETSFDRFMSMYRRAWVYLALLPIPLFSIGVGIYLRRKGKRALKNIIVGIVVVVLLIMNGAVLYTSGRNTQTQLENYFFSVEKCLDMDFPAMEQFYFDSVISLDGGAAYPVNSVYFVADACAGFERQMSQDIRWLTELPDELAMCSVALEQELAFDYMLLYNATTGELNSIPTETGKYRFLCVWYDLDTHCLQICEYNLTF